MLLTYIVIAFSLLLVLISVAGFFHEEIGIEDGTDLLAIFGISLVCAVLWFITLPIFILGACSAAAFNLGKRIR